MNRSVDKLGATPLSTGGVLFRVWAPRVRRMQLEIVSPAASTHEMRKIDDDVFETHLAEAGVDTDYFFILDGEKRRPDPMSRCQPMGVHGPSRIVDPAFAWTDQDWIGLELADYVFSEIHIGLFTPEGTFDAAVAKLPHLMETGITAIEIMPVSAFPGNRNWGYDGVHHFAPTIGYGGVGGLKRLVDASHAAGLAVVMDVVYNHLGPEGNYLAEFGPYFTNRYRTPWGDAVNFDGEGSAGVRQYFVDNAVHWLEEYHFDALRLDAVHEIYDQSPRHILQEIADSFHEAGARINRRCHVIAESPLNDAQVIRPVSLGGCGLDAQWNDDFHHALRTFITGESKGYMSGFGKSSDLVKAITEGYVRPGDDLRSHKKGAPDAKDRPGEQMVVCIQNHDQIANASGGRRIADEMGLETAKAAAALVLLSPALPLLFMGEEYGETARFEFFADFGDDNLVNAVREGRKREIESYGFDAGDADPFDIRLFERCRLDWSKLAKSSHDGVLRCYRDLLKLRRNHAALRNGRKDLTNVTGVGAPGTGASGTGAPGNDQNRWVMMERRDPSTSEPAIRVCCNFTNQLVLINNIPPAPWRRLLWTGAREYGGLNKIEATEVLREGEAIILPAWSAAVYELTRS